MIPAPRVNTAQQSIMRTIPAPVGGLNGRDSIAAMPETDAYLMDDCLPAGATVDLRSGSDTFVSGLAGPVKTLAVYAGAAGDKLLAFAGGHVYDITSGTATSLVSSKNNDDVITAMFSNAADNAQHLIITTGVDTPYAHNGTALNNLAITGVAGSVTTLNYVYAFKGRLYFAQKDKLGFYYLGVGAIQGAATYFDLGQVSKLGGHLVAIASYSDGSGDTPNDYIVFITSKGECIVFNGFDPSNANNWSLVGRYYSSPLINRKCTFNYGSELILLSLEGAVSFSEVRRVGDAKARGVTTAEYSAITSKLGKFLSVLNNNADVYGWQGLVAAKEGLLLINAPATASPSGAYYLFAMNTITNAWGRVTRWNGISYATFNKRVYFGTFDGKVKLAFEGATDDGSPILANVKQAYSYFDTGGGNNSAFERKHFQWANILVSSNGKPPITAQFNVDYAETEPEYLSDIDEGTGAVWDVASWDTASWSSDDITQRILVTLNKTGVAGSLWLRISAEGITLQWYATNYAFERLRGLLL